MRTTLASREVYEEKIFVSRGILTEEFNSEKLRHQHPKTVASPSLPIHSRGMDRPFFLRETGDWVLFRLQAAG
jgi:hypothetical protein